MSAVAGKLKVDLGRSCWSADCLLAHCEGYRVESAAGKLGYVEEVVWTPGHKWSRPYSEPAALRVSGEHGRFTIPIEDVCELHAEGGWIVAHAPGVVLADRRPGPRPE